MRQETSPRDSDSFWSRPAAAILFAVTAALVGSAAALAVYRAHADRMELATGRAEWIWYPGPVAQPQAVRFFATRDFELPQAPARATAKIFVDREHVLYVNGERAGDSVQHAGDPLVLHDVARLLRPGVNRIAIEAASPTGIGGILFSLDLDGYGRDALVSDGGWRVDASREAVSRGGSLLPQVLGRPPRYPWGYPRMPRPEERREGP